jgi:hypothetical protein
MSYFTAPNDITMMEPRLILAVRLASALDIELKVAIRRDVRNLVFGAHGPHNVLIRLYCSALPDGRTLLEELSRELDPTLTTAWLRAC